MFKVNSKIGFIIILCVTIASIYPLFNLRFNFDMNKFFPVGDPDLEYYQQFKQKYHSEIDDEYIFIGLRNENGIFDQKFLKKVDTLTKFVKTLDNVISTYSITNTRHIYSNEFEQITSEPLIHIDSINKYQSDSIKLFASKEYTGFFVSKSRKATAISAFNKPNLTGEEKDTLLNSIQHKIDELGFDKSYFTAKIRVEQTYIHEIRKNMQLYLIVSFVLILIMYYVIFRTIKGLIIPIIIIGSALAWSLAFVGLFNYPLDIISSLIPPVLAVVCMSGIVYITSKYFEELQNGLDKKAALTKTFKDIGLAIFLCAITTSIGFYSLCTINLLPIRMFGFFAGTGVLLCYFIAIVFTYAVYDNTSKPVINNTAKADSKWRKFMSFSFLNLVKHRKVIVSIQIVLVLVSLFFISKIEINSSLLEEIPKHNPILEDYKFIEEEFSGTRAIELSIQLKDNNNFITEIPVLNELEAIEQYLSDSCGVGFMISPLTHIKSVNKSFHAGDPKWFKIPENRKQVNYFCGCLMMLNNGEAFLRNISPDWKEARINGKLPNISTKDFKKLSQRLEDFYHRKGFKYISYRLTGSSLLLDKVSYTLIENMFYGLLIGFISIITISAFMFRSVKMIFLVLIPNIIPLLFMAAMMGILGIYLKGDTSMIFAIAFAISCDGTIYYLTRFRLSLKEGRSVLYSVKRAFLSTGKAIITNDIILFTGFFSLMFSSFGGTFYVGLLISTFLLFAIISDLTILPLLLLIFYKKKKKE